MNNITKHIVRVVLILVVQILILKDLNLNFSDYDYIHLFLYPVLIILFPIKTPQPLLMTIGLVIGLTLDMFYDSPGLHASTCVFIAFVRNLILKIIEPVEGYKIEQNLSISNMGIGWMASYLSLMMFLHLTWYFSFEAFSFVFIKEIVLRIIFSFMVSMLFVLLYVFVFNPKQN